MVMGKQNIEISPRTMTSVVRVNFSKKRLIVIAIFKSTIDLIESERGEKLNARPIR